MFFKINFIINFFLFFFFSKIYINYFYINYFFKNNFFFFFQNNFSFSKINSIYLLLSLFILFFSINILNDLKLKNKYKYLFYSIIIPLFFLIFTNNIFIFFFFYEVLLLISTTLIYYFSPNTRAKTVAAYFLFWTQLGSFLLLIAIILIFIKFNSINFFILKNYKYCFYLQLLIFFGLGIKVPVWPFSFWITKAHVEVNTSFSIFLSGILVKIAIIGFNKFYFIFDN